jgi:hypothetical protein
MTPEQRAARNAAVGAGQRRAWADPEIHARRSAAIRAAKDDPLHRAIARNRTEKQTRDKQGRFR